MQGANPCPVLTLASSYKNGDMLAFCLWVWNAVVGVVWINSARCQCDVEDKQVRFLPPTLLAKEDGLVGLYLLMSGNTRTYQITTP